MAEQGSFKLPAFWTQQPHVWFSQAEAQFFVRKIEADNVKYYLTVAALDQETATRILDLLNDPPVAEKYDKLKRRLLDTFALSQYECAGHILHMPDLGDEKPSCLMDKMLSFLGNHPPCFLFKRIFLERLPEDIRATLVHSQEQDCRKLAKAADILWLARPSPTNVITRRWNKFKPKVQAPNLCFYHKRFGNKAHSCQPPCEFDSMKNKTSGNEEASRQ